MKEVKRIGDILEYSNNRQAKRYSCHQPIQMIVTQAGYPRPNTLINGVILNATKSGLYIQTPSEIKEGKVFFSYNDPKSSSTLLFECNVLRTDLNGIAVTYYVLSDPFTTEAYRRHDGNTSQVRKGRLLDLYF